MLEKRSMSVLDEAALEELQRVLLCNLAPSGSNSSSSSENNHHHYHHSAESNHIRNQSINILEEESRLIEQFREDLSGQGYRFPQSDDFFLPFIRLSKGKPRTALRKIQKFIASRVETNSFIADFGPNWPEDLQICDAIEHKTVIEMPKLSKNNITIKYIRYNPDIGLMENLNSLLYTLALHCELCFLNPYYTIFGCKYVVNIQNVRYHIGIQLYKKKMREFCRQLMNLLQRYPATVKEIHLINCGKIFGFIVDSLLGLASKKIQGRFICHSSASGIYKSIEPECVPNEVKNGCGGDFDRIFEQNRSSFFENRIYIFPSKEFFAPDCQSIKLDVKSDTLTEDNIIIAKSKKNTKQNHSISASDDRDNVPNILEELQRK